MKLWLSRQHDGRYMITALRPVRALIGRTREALSKAHTHLGKIERLEKHVAKLEQCSANDRDTKIDIEIQ